MTTRTTRLRRSVLASCAALGTAVAGVAYAAPADAATSSVTLNRGVLAVQGDSGRNAFVVGRTTTGVITLNGAEVLAGTATVADVSLLVLDGGGGNDNMRVDESNGAMPAARLIGDAGNDQLAGGSGADELFGGDGVDTIDAGRGDDTILAGRGNDKVTGGFGTDVALLGDDSDQFTWNPGDGSDFVEGEGGKDTLLFNGSAANELVDVVPDGDHLRIARNIGGVVMRVAGLELVKTDLSRGQDLVQVGDLTGTGTNQLQISFAPLSGPDDRSDTVVVAGTSAADRIRVGGPSAAGTVTVSGLRATVLVTGAWALAVRGLAGDDVIDATRLSAGAVALTETGDSGNDILIGTPGNDTLLGGSGNDRLEGRGGTDALDGGPGDNVIIP